MWDCQHWWGWLYDRVMGQVIWVFSFPVILWRLVNKVTEVINDSILARVSIAVKRSHDHRTASCRYHEVDWDSEVSWAYNTSRPAFNKALSIPTNPHLLIMPLPRRLCGPITFKLPQIVFVYFFGCLRIMCIHMYAGSHAWIYREIGGQP